MGAFAPVVPGKLAPLTRHVMTLLSCCCCCLFVAVDINFLNFVYFYRTCHQTMLATGVSGLRRTTVCARVTPCEPQDRSL